MQPGLTEVTFTILQDGRATPDLDAAMQELQNEVLHLKSVEEEITGYAERALAETERLTKENEDLKKSQEDATLDRWAPSSSILIAMRCVSVSREFMLVSCNIGN